MEDDDEFGDLYTDVLRPFAASFQSPIPDAAPPTAKTAAPPPIDLNRNSDDEEILYGAASDSKNSNSNPQTLPKRTEFDLNLEFASRGTTDFGNRVLEKGGGVNSSNLIDGDDDDLDIVVEDRDVDDDDLLGKGASTNNNNNDIIQDLDGKGETGFDLGKGSEVGEEQMIPGISGGLANPKGGSNFEDDWDSEDSEDDLQIVLNDNDGPMMGMERADDGEDGEPLVIVADNGDEGYLHHTQQMMEEQQWGGDEAADRERKELGDAAKPGVAAVGPNAQAALQPKVGYSNHPYHPPFHSQFKYVRPGAAPVAPGGMPGQVRPPFPAGPIPGRGRGDWRPAGVKGDMQKGFHPGYGMHPWGTNSAGRGYGSGLDFTLPSHKTIFEVDIDSFEEKPWKLPGIDMSDFFNFGLNEESWKDYRKQLEQLRLGTTMQNKIRVYESGRAEQDYDPDLPPELAAAVGNQDTPSESAIPRTVDAGPTDSATVRGRPLPPVGRPIPVEISSGDRPPSADTRRQRMHDNDAIIEIVCNSFKDDEDSAEHQDDISGEVDIGGGDEVDDLQHDIDHNNDPISHAYNGRKREPLGKRGQSKQSSPEVPSQSQPDGEDGVRHDARSVKGRGRVRSPKMTARADKRQEKIIDDADEESLDSGNSKHSPPSSPRPIGSDGEQAVIAGDDMNDSKSDRSFDTEGEDVAVDEDNSDTLEDKQKLSPLKEQVSQEKDEDGDEALQDHKARSGSSKDNRKFRDGEDEVIQDRRPPKPGNIKKPVGDEDYARRKVRHERDETGRKHVSAKGREESHPRGNGDPNLSLRRHMKGESTDWRKDSNTSEGNWQWRDEERHGRGFRADEARKNDYGVDTGSRNRVKVRESEKILKEEHHQSRNLMDNGSWRAANHDRDARSKLRDRDQSLKSRSGKADDILNKKRKEGAYLSREHAVKEDISQSQRETSSRRKRERDDVSDQWKRDEQARVKGEDLHHVRHREDDSLQRERNDREREHDEWHRLKVTPEDIISRREREEARPMMRSGRATEDKAWNSHSRKKDDYRGSSKEYHPNDVGRHNDQFKRKDRLESESFSHHRVQEDLYARGNLLGHDEKRARYERPGPRNDRAPLAYDTSRGHEHRQKETRRKGKDSESVGRGSSQPSKRNLDEQGGQTSQTVNPRGKTERESGENDTHATRQSPKKHKDEASEDEEQPSSKRGRSKLERWTSNKDRDFTTTSISSSSSARSKDIDALTNCGAPLVNGLHEEPSKNTEDKPQPLVEDKDASTDRNVKPKVAEDKHLDTVAKLKKRSERFKLPMPSEKETVAIKKTESEPLPPAQTETATVSEVKPERPARKRRWTGN